MTKEIRVSCFDIASVPPEDYSMMKILKERGFPVDDSLLFALKPKQWLHWFQFHDHKTEEFVVQWEE